MEIQTIQNKIYEIRGSRVMLDFDLAELYGVETRVLKQAVRRNFERFEGDDFMFELTESESNRLDNSLRSQFVISNERGGRRYSSFAFTEIGVSMLSSVLRSPAAIYANRAIMRAFVSMRNYLATTSKITTELSELRAIIELMRRDDEETMEAVNDLSEYTREEIDNLYNAFAALSAKTPQVQKPRPQIGFQTAGTTKQ
jgi:signal transduction histidine kinase